MQRKTKIGLIMILVGALMFLVTPYIMAFHMEPTFAFSETGIIIWLPITLIGAIMAVIGGSMVKTRMNRWMDED